MNGLEESAIRQTLQQQAGYSDEVITELIQNMLASPIFQAGKQISRERRKLEWLLRVYHHTYNQSAYAHTIERRASLDNQEFIEQYYSNNRPVILTDVLKHWPIMERWSWDYLKEKFGARQVEIQHYERNAAGEPEYIKDKMDFSQFIDRIQLPDCPSDLYMTAYNAVSNQGLLAELRQEVMPDLPDFLDPATGEGRVLMWLGPQNTMGRFHMDLANSVLAQVKGRKEIRIVPSFSLPYVYHDFAMVSALNLDDWDEQRFPMFKHVPVITLILEPGEMLFIPIGWWHQVRALSPSISLTFTNFRVDNQYFYTEDIYSPE